MTIFLTTAYMLIASIAVYLIIATTLILTDNPKAPASEKSCAGCRKGRFGARC